MRDRDRAAVERVGRGVDIVGSSPDALAMQFPAPAFVRHPENPIVRPGSPAWRSAVTFNPAVWYEGGTFWMFERAAGSFRPFVCSIGLRTSEDGVHFKPHGDRPVITPEMCGSKFGSVQDPRVVKIGGTYYLAFAYRPYAWSSHPTGVGVPESHETDFPGVDRPAFNPANAGSGNVQGGRSDNMTRSGLAVSDNLIDWTFHSWVTPETMDDRDVILFPEKIGGRYVVLRRPLDFVGARFGTTGPSIWLSRSDDLKAWTDPVLVAKAEYAWEDNRIGGSTPPIKTDNGWLVLYHGVQTLDPKVKHVVYRVGAMMLDLHDPTKVIARCPHALMEPQEYYEQRGAYIPDVIFPTANIVRDSELWIYYGCCDTAIALATVNLDELVRHVMGYRI